MTRPVKSDKESDNIYYWQLPQALMTRPVKSDKESDKKKKRKLSGGDELLRGFLLIHESIAATSTSATPRRFMAFLRAYEQMYASKKEGIEIKQQHLQVC